MAVRKGDLESIRVIQDMPNFSVFPEKRREIEQGLQGLIGRETEPKARRDLEVALARHQALQGSPEGGEIIRLLQLGEPELAEHYFLASYGANPSPEFLVRIQSAKDKKAIRNGECGTLPLAKVDPQGALKKLLASKQAISNAQINEKEWVRLLELIIQGNPIEEIQRLLLHSSIEPQQLYELASDMGSALIGGEVMSTLFRKAWNASDAQILALRERDSMATAVYITPEEIADNLQKLANAYDLRNMFVDSANIQAGRDKAKAALYLADHFVDVIQSGDTRSINRLIQTAIRLGVDQELGAYLLANNQFEQAAFLADQGGHFHITAELIQTHTSSLRLITIATLQKHLEALSTEVETRSFRSADVRMALIRHIQERFEEEGDFKNASQMARLSGETELARIYEEIASIIDEGVTSI